jgi:pimeloyl-ACP methyl ester carboxylesterase
VPGTGTPDPTVVPNYLENAVNYYVVPGGNCGSATPSSACPDTTTGIKYYATFWPIPLPGSGGLSGQTWNVSVGQGVEHLTDAYKPVPAGDTVTIFRYSQGATVATNFKRLHPQNSGDPGPKTTYFFIGDPQRPSGGFFERFAFLGNVPILDAQFGDPAPTDTCDNGNTICATDLALQYDGVADFPQWLLNPLAVLNAAAGFVYIHGTYLAPDDGDAATATPYGYTPEEVQDIIEAA